MLHAGQFMPGITQQTDDCRHSDIFSSSKNVPAFGVKPIHPLPAASVLRTCANLPNVAWETTGNSPRSPVIRLHHLFHLQLIS